MQYPADSSSKIIRQKYVLVTDNKTGYSATDSTSSALGISKKIEY